ncbi:MAG: hypothetical protein LQ338_005664, partial [Usnochroma carphineum]
MFLAMVAETYLAAGPDLDNASTVKLSRSYAVQVPPSDVATACGLDLLIHTGDYRSLRHCTLGGLIVVNDQILGLTAGHPFSIIKHEKIPWEHLDVHQIVEDFGDEGNSTASSEPFVFNDDDDDRSDANRDSSASTSSVHEAGVLRPSIDARPYRRSEASRAFPSSMNSYPSQAAILPASSPAYVTPVDDLLIDHDWALLEALPHIVTSRPNKVAHIDQRRDSLIEGLVSGPACGEVTITTGGIGPQSGYLHSSPATMKVDTSVLEVQLITLERFLPLGSSGAWDVPWAYMVAIEPVLKDIRRKLKTDDVRLLTAIEMDRLAASSKMASMKLSHELDEELPPRTSEADQANKPSKGSADLRTFSPRKKRRKTHKYLPAELQDGRANRESRLSRTPADGSLDEKSNIQDHAPQTSLVQPSLQPGDRRQEYSVVTAPT